MITVTSKQRKDPPSSLLMNKNQNFNTSNQKKKRPLSDSNDEKSKKKVRIVENKHNTEKSTSPVLDDKNGNPEVSRKVYQTYLKNAFDALDKNDASFIQNMTNKLSLPRTSPESLSYATMGLVLDLLSNRVSQLDSPHCNSLILAILRTPNWSKQEESFLTSYVTFLSVLTSGIPKWHKEIVNVLISDFSRMAPSPKTATDLGNNAKPHHEYLQYLLRIIPTSLNVVLKSLVRSFPGKYCTKNDAVNYVSNLLAVMAYAPEIRFQLLTAIFEYCVKLDVELKNNLDEVDEDVEEEDIDDNDDEEEEEEDDDDDDEDDEEEDDDDDEEHEEYNADLTININELSEKLDRIMEKLLIGLQSLFTVENLNSGDGITVYRSLISIFKSYILSTSNTKSVQFILFHFSQQQPELIDAFLVSLIDITFDFSESLEQRIKAVQYLSSYLSRAKQVSKNQLIFVVSYLVNWLEKYVDERECEVGNGSGGMERFKMFYAILQCLLYIFCFRHEQLRKSVAEWECNINKFFQKMILTKFNPLKFCNETVALMFAKIAHQEDVAYCFSIIEHNRRDQFNSYSKTPGKHDQKSPSSSSSSSSKKASIINDSRILFFSKQEFLDLVAYFPFDPLILKRSKALIQGNYIEWSDIQSDDQDSDSNSDDYDDGSTYAREFVRKNSSVVADADVRDQIRKQLKSVRSTGADDVFDDTELE
ncbi:rDNA-binding RNA polymerase I transcriptional factor [Saccharomycopsis crataegensis]|uniref:rDNA-binding RNA polymerase I transcriptional factor n=1 Tax=Saccharomycopsis crataegensis TaxID=43959 RepID=A0AAV5QQY7_9ASCO|nr:rDNA-binding RNA polymerase I transcriptional factor [Saccharomycopsis crataegensis]